MQKRCVSLCDFLCFAALLSAVVGLLVSLWIVTANHYLHHRLYNLVLFEIRDSLNRYVFYCLSISLALYALYAGYRLCLRYKSGTTPTPVFRWAYATLSILIMYVAIKIFVCRHPFIAAEQAAMELAKSQLPKWHVVYYALWKKKTVAFGISLAAALCAFALFHMVSRREGLARRIIPVSRVSAILLIPAWIVLNACVSCCVCREGDQRPNVILVFFDALRADHLGCYGYERDTSPCIDEIARGGIRCKNVYAQGSATYPSVHCTLTSQYANAFFRKRICDKIALDEEFLTVAELFRNYGYFTVGITSSPIVADRGMSFSCGGFEQGFERFDSDTCFGGEFNWQYRNPEGVIEKALAWLRSNHEKKFFMFLYVMDPHDRYIPSPPYDKLYDPDYHGKWLVESGGPARYYEKLLYGERVDLAPRDIRHFIALYDGEVRYADATLARLWSYLKSAGLLDNTLVVVTADHGEEFYDHGGLKHNHTLYNELISIPVIFHYEGSSPRGIVMDREILQAVDTVPTILDYAGIPKPSVMQGESILTLLERRDAPWRDYVISENSVVNAKAFISGEWKYIHHFGSDVNYCKKYTEGRELYNMVDDPKERHNLYGAFPETARHLYGRMMAVLPTTERERIGGKTATKLDESSRRRLRALGYVQ